MSIFVSTCIPVHVQPRRLRRKGRAASSSRRPRTQSAAARASASSRQTRSCRPSAAARRTKRRPNARLLRPQPRRTKRSPRSARRSTRSDTSTKAPSLSHKVHYINCLRMSDCSSLLPMKCSMNDEYHDFIIALVLLDSTSSCLLIFAPEIDPLLSIRFEEISNIFKLEQLLRACALLVQIAPIGSEIRTSALITAHSCVVQIFKVSSKAVLFYSTHFQTYTVQSILYSTCVITLVRVCILRVYNDLYALH